ncbi:MAG: hypothetical protein II984_11465, partial [Clostridia bacterium]|nr:hypothetical protein [Clostridia bacterium]
AYIQDFSSCVCALSACNRGWGLAHSGFVWTNAMLALSGIFEFSAKDITLFRDVFMLSLYVVVKIV